MLTVWKMLTVYITVNLKNRFHNEEGKSANNIHVIIDYGDNNYTLVLIYPYIYFVNITCEPIPVRNFFFIFFS